MNRYLKIVCWKIATFPLRVMAFVLIASPLPFELAITYLPMQRCPVVA